MGWGLECNCGLPRETWSEGMEAWMGVEKGESHRARGWHCPGGGFLAAPARASFPFPGQAVASSCLCWEILLQTNAVPCSDSLQPMSPVRPWIVMEPLLQGIMCWSGGQKCPILLAVVFFVFSFNKWIFCVCISLISLVKGSLPLPCVQIYLKLWWISSRHLSLWPAHFQQPAFPHAPPENHHRDYDPIL